MSWNWLGELVVDMVTGNGPMCKDGPVVMPSPRKYERPRGRTLFETIFRDGAKPVVGSVVCCRLGGVLEHSGVYVGRNRIVHRDGDGFLAPVSPEEFLARLDGLNPAVSIHVSCDEDGAVGSPDVAARARAALKSPLHRKGYNLFTKNCHQFCQYCLTGDSDGSVFNCSFGSLEDALRDELGFTNWRRWDYAA